ncbi:MAG: hypothetical protein WD749_09710 [Phycisphaerales bacterium]
MAKAGDLLGRSGAGGLGPSKPTQAFPTPETKDEGEGADHSATKKKPIKDTKPHKGGGPSGGGTLPTSVRPKV